MALKRALLQEDASFVNVLQYGNVTTHTTIQAAITAIGSTRAVLMLTPGSWSITGNLTIPTNILLWIVAGATVAIGTGVTLTVSEYIADLPDWRSGGGTLSHLRYTEGAGRIGWKQTGTGAADRSVDDKLKDVLDVRDFGMLPSVSNNSSAFQAAVTAAAAAGRGLRIPGGTYPFTTTLSITTAGLHVFGVGRVVLQHTGTGAGVFVDGGAAGNGIYNVLLDNLTVQGNTNTTNAWQFRASHNMSCKNLRAVDCDIGFVLQGCNGGYLEALSCSSFEQTFAKIPQAGIHLTRRSAGEPTTNCVIQQARCEGITGGSGWGILLEYATRCHVAGGAFRFCKTGGQIDTAANGNRFHTFSNCIFEGNATYDFILYGHLNAFHQCQFTSAGTVGTIQVQTNAFNNTWHACYARKLEFLTSSFYNDAYDSFFDSSVGLGIQGAGIYRLRNCHKVDGNLVWQSSYTDS